VYGWSASDCDNLWQVCGHLSVPTLHNHYESSFLCLLHTLIVLHITSFKDMKISNYFCHPSQILYLACSDTVTKNIATYIVSAICGFFLMSGILWSYYRIVSSIIKIPSFCVRYKAFSTCGSHLLVVCLFYGTVIGAYLRSSVSHSPSKNMVASVMYTVVTPFIYSLRNKDISNALKRLHRRRN
jgi:olfactory receptor